ncbi:MAG: hypothetical protein LQ351_002088 [Letrouitia transgressa]|nr:MAG: hypothetical protein LQ351_002088 [Letrouitia transgressa]
MATPTSDPISPSYQIHRYLKLNSTNDILDRSKAEWVALLPLLPTYFHLLISAIAPIYAGAHASLSRPSSAAKSKPQETQSGDDEFEVEETKMEGLSPLDALIFPLVAGATLVGLYFIIKWLQDPALLNMVLNLYFSGFGILSLTKMYNDSWNLVISFCFPEAYSLHGKFWRFKNERRAAVSSGDMDIVRQSPLPGELSRLQLPTLVSRSLWRLRDPRLHSLCVHIFIHKMVDFHIHISTQSLISAVVATCCILYYNLMSRPWWLTNLQGFGFAYSSLQLMSPTTNSTGSLILGALFFYDIYFVFFTPVMVAVATKLDIPAKLLFPRPRGPNEDPSKQPMSMLGLGDVVLPGMMIGMALRFDLYLFYLKKQKKEKYVGGPQEGTTGSQDPYEQGTAESQKVVKAPWIPATGQWGSRFWTSQAAIPRDDRLRGVLFSKTYFRAALSGYTIGMLSTLTIMQLYGHAQPALLYLVPAVLVSFWGTAIVKGEAKLMWRYDESSEEEEGSQSKTQRSIFSPKRQEEISKKLEKKIKDVTRESQHIDENGGKENDQQSKRKIAETKNTLETNQKSKWLLFSVKRTSTSCKKGKAVSAILEIGSADRLEKKKAVEKTTFLESR